MIDLNAYTTLRRDRSDRRRGGGVCVYTKNCLPIIRLKDLPKPEFETLWLLIKPSRLPRGLNSIILGAIYHPTKNFVLSRIGRYILLADFNQFNHRYLCNSFSLKQIVKHATRGSNILDKVFTNISKYYDVPQFNDSFTWFSDHNSVFVKPCPIRTRDHLEWSETRVFLVESWLPKSYRILTTWTPMYHMNKCVEQFEYLTHISVTFAIYIVPL